VYIAYFVPLLLFLPWDTLSLWVSWLGLAIFFTVGLAFVIRGLLLFFEFDDLGGADYYASIVSLSLWIITASWDLLSSRGYWTLLSAISLFNVLFIVHQTRAKYRKAATIYAIGSK
jgi:hypothetical protein